MIRFHTFMSQVLIRWANYHFDKIPYEEPVLYIQQACKYDCEQYIYDKNIVSYHRGKLN